MELFEFEAKSLLKKYGLTVPHFYDLLDTWAPAYDVNKFPAMAKVQILQGGRGKRGGVKLVNDRGELNAFIDKTRLTKFDGETTDKILIEEPITEQKKNLYVSLSFLYPYKAPVLTVNNQGGVEVDQAASESQTFPIDVINHTYDEAKVEQFLGLADSERETFRGTIKTLIECFITEDCRLIEINPLTLTTDDRLLALDAKIMTDDRASVRHSNRNSKLNQERKEQSLSELERSVIELNSRAELGGSPCRYVELNGDVALLLSGGGASLLVFEQLLTANLKPGNYSEYSGNPRREKVEALTRVILSKPQQRGLLIAGGVANFTQIDESMAGVAAALVDFKPSYPIVIRRGGPGEEQAKEIMTKLAASHKLDLTWFGSETPLSEAVKFFISKLTDHHD